MKTWSEMAEIQPLASKIITNSIKKDRISHAYLLQGERGVGKEKLALLLVKGLFCLNKRSLDPCNDCIECKRITSRNHPDVHWVEPDGQSIRIEQIRNLQKEFSYSGLESTRKAYIIKGSETLTLNAANRILKFLEEPGSKTTAIMLTENSQSIIPTIRSRCQIIDLQPLNPTAFQRELKKLNVHEKNIKLLSALTNNFSEAIELSEDEWFAEARKIVLQLVDTYIKNPTDLFLFIHDEWFTHFKKRDQQERGLDLLLFTFKDILYSHIGKEDSMVVFTRGEERLTKALDNFSEETILSILDGLLKAKRKLKQNVNPTLVMEQLTLQIIEVI